MNDQNSILDKVIHSKQEAEMRGFNPIENISALLKHLTNKESEVLRRRFGLNSKPKETLESIGKVYNVTRERIRQIENTSIQKIKSLKDYPLIANQLEHIITAILKQNGDLMEENALLNELLSFSSNLSENRNCAIFILEQLLNGKINKINSSNIYKKSWSLPYLSLDFVEKVINLIIEIIKKENKPININQILEKFYQDSFYESNKEKLNKQVIISYIKLSQKIGSNPFGDYGLSDWGLINPRRMRDKIYLVLKKEEKPLHFNKITELINNVKFDDRKAYAPTVHNELILNKDFVLVGRGIYALQEWGYKPGVVADVLIEILKKANEPLTREDLVKRVLEQRMVRKNTIHLALTDKTKFKKVDDTKYTLVENLTVSESK